MKNWKKIIKAYTQYTLHTIWHILNVIKYGRRLGVPWSHLLQHDLSKFSRAEFRYSALFWFGDDELKTPEVIVGYDNKHNGAWQNHVIYNPHHPEHWELLGAPQVMPDIYVKEMVADLQAAEITNNGQVDMSNYLNNVVIKNPLIANANWPLIADCLYTLGYEFTPDGVWEYLGEE